MTTPCNCIGIGGAPATGKSTVIKTFLRDHDLTTPDPFEYGTLKGTLYRDARICLLGVYDDGEFTGTDRLAMNVAPDASQFIEDAADSPTYDDYTILYEGDRLFTGSFIDHAITTLGTDNTWFPILTAPDDELERRHAHRDDDQSDAWLTGRRTKYENLAADYDLPLIPHTDHADTHYIAARIAARIGLTATPGTPTSSATAAGHTPTE